MRSSSGLYPRETGGPTERFGRFPRRRFFDTIQHHRHHRNCSQTVVALRLLDIGKGYTASSASSFLHLLSMCDFGITSFPVNLERKEPVLAQSLPFPIRVPLTAARCLVSELLSGVGPVTLKLLSQI
jgi:hypothetical protein